MSGVTLACIGLGLLAVEPALATLPDKAALSADAADSQILSEVIVGGQRIGLILSAPRTLFVRDTDGSQTRNPPSGNYFAAVVLREEGTRRFISGARVRVELGRYGEVGLAEFNSSMFPMYGTNVTLAEEALDLIVHVSPSGATARFSLDAQGAVVDPLPIRAADPGYVFGSDVAAAMEVFHDSVVAGDYLIGFIPGVAQEGLHPLAIAVFDRRTGLPVTGCEVQLSLFKKDKRVSEFELLPVMGEFQHYGTRAAVEPGKYQLRARVGVPRAGSVDTALFEDPAILETAWAVGAFSKAAERKIRLAVIIGMVAFVVLVIWVTRSGGMT